MRCDDGRVLAVLSLTFALLLGGLACSDDPQASTVGGADASADVPDADTAGDVEPGDAEPGDVAADVVAEEDAPILDASAYSFGEPGPWAVGRLSFVLEDGARGRRLPVTIFYPAAPSAAGAAAASEPIEALIMDEARRQTFADLLTAAPEGCPTRRVHSAADAPMADATSPWPLVVYSHCFQCLGVSGATIAVHLASRGIIVAMPDHTDDTLFDKLDGAESQLGDAFLQVRAADLSAVIDRLLSAEAPELLRDRVDASRIGVMGHSFGAVTTGRLLQLEDRVVAGLAFAAPMENPLFPSVHMAEIHRPVMWVVAGEDNSIMEIGNLILRTNFEAANLPAWKVEVADAGHWSFSDLCGLVDAFAPGCGEGSRQTRPGEPFSYLPVADGLEIGRRYAAAFFAAQLQGDEAGYGALEEAFPSGQVKADARR